MGNLRKRAIASLIVGGLFGGITVIACSGGDDSGAGGADAATDVIRKDASVIDVAETGNACTPVLPTGWPTWTPPNPISSACTSTQVQAYYDNCYASTATTTCSTFTGDPQNSPCIKCVGSSQEAATYGPVISLDNGTARVNFAGCIALTDGDLTSTGCGAQYQAYDLCPGFSCAEGCAVDYSTSATETATYNAFLACGTQASSSVCKPFAKPACASDAMYAHCTYANFESNFIGLSDYFCAAESDGGADAD